MIFFFDPSFLLIQDVISVLFSLLVEIFYGELPHLIFYIEVGLIHFIILAVLSTRLIHQLRQPLFLQAGRRSRALIVVIEDAFNCFDVLNIIEIEHLGRLKLNVVLCDLCLIYLNLPLQIGQNNLILNGLNMIIFCLQDNTAPLLCGPSRRRF